MSENSKVTKLSEPSDDQPSSAEGSPASHTVLRENVRRLVMTVISGRSSGESFARLSPGGFWVKTSQDYVQVRLDGSLEEYSETWPRWGIMSGGVAGKLPISEHPTIGNGSSLLPTVTTQEVEHPEMKISDTGRRKTKDNQNTHSIGLSDRIAMLPIINILPTPSVCGNYNRKGASKTSGNGLATAIKILPTVTTPRPHDNEETAGKFLQSQNQKDLTTIIAMLPPPCSCDYKGGTKKAVEAGNPKKKPDCEMQTNGLKLQPAFAEWMMGVPIGYTDLPHSEMLSSRNKSTRSSKK